ncbi:metal-dependent hydrolase [Meridianimarinicoccus sp. MJW13]|uniref:metal-dependent hydrolase n=1 Tax=Meridianimarinicoccus sp. MJW13 TaxID=2720031 RepID=UPI0018676B50|nr:metal-dependent hydrolase [Fluviibacterium sp. MJW13]
MKITWLGHSGFRIEIGNQILLVDPWLDGNPAFPDDRRAETIAGATAILMSHGHFDHTGDMLEIARALEIPVVGSFDIVSHWEAAKDIHGVGFNKGGTVQLGDVKVTMVHAVHSSSLGTDHGPMYAGGEAGFMIAQGGRTIYFSGDTDVMMDMELFQDLHHPEIGILCCGGHFTMDMARAAYAAKRFFTFKTVIPCHYKTFPLLEQSAQPLVDALPDVDVKTPEVMETLTL